VVADGDYAKAPLLKPAIGLGMTVVSRLRNDAALRTVPAPGAERRGRQRMHRGGRIVLAERAGRQQVWFVWANIGAFQL
jgi:hypothetical protein